MAKMMRDLGWLGRSTNENLDVVRIGYTNEWKDCCLFISLNRFGCVHCASQANPYRDDLVLWDFSAYQPVFTSKALIGLYRGFNEFETG